ncbi:MAG: hypothetical protein RI945_150 [Candidatus Parcubacteria bacterium]|jgi:Mg/Co/Ni transporter MgtE
MNFKVILVIIIFALWFIYFYGNANLHLQISKTTAKIMVYASFAGILSLIFFKK